MRDEYFYKSLVVTVFAFCGVLVSLTAFVIFTGVAGGLLLLVAVVLLLTCVYGGFGKIVSIGKYKFH
ncbi:MAG: hypothetical protein GY941_29535 [Planctomycetes bacterium]|nr:hypothetical protein [Planctomycetota bacterium]